MSMCCFGSRAALAIVAVCALAGGAAAQCPTPPSSLGASGGCDGIALQWSGLGAGTQGINVYRSTVNSAGAATFIGSAGAAPAGSYTDTTAVVGQTYFYFLAGATTPGAGCPGGVGPFSPSVTAVRPGAIVQTPASLQASNPTCSPVTLSWSGVPGAESYVVYSSTSPTLGANPTPIATVNATGVAVNLPPGAVGSAYYFVAAANSCGIGPIAGPAAVSLSGAPASVSNITATGVNGCNGVLLTWNAADRAQTYTVLGALNEGVFNALGTVTAPATSFTHTPGPGQRRWRYAVTGANGCGQSPVTEFAQIDLSQSVSVVSSPGSLAVNAGQTIALDARVENAAGLRWKRDGVDLVDGNGVTGATTNQLRIARATPAHAGVYTLAAAPCAGPATSTASAIVAVRQSCPADIDASGAVNLDDVFIFLNAFFAGCP